jgi:hypothetical protein
MPSTASQRRIHVALAVQSLEQAIPEFAARLGVQPTVVAAGAYALFVTPEVNLSISEIPEQAGQLRHLGFEDECATTFAVHRDSSGFVWETFSAELQRQEIEERWPGASWATSRSAAPTAS